MHCISCCFVQIAGHGHKIDYMYLLKLVRSLKDLLEERLTEIKNISLGGAESMLFIFCVLYKMHGMDILCIKDYL